MPVIITKGGTDFYLVPSPLLSFSRSTFNNVGRAGFGAEYSATHQPLVLALLMNQTTVMIQIIFWRRH
jgi:hypothetical protein